MMSVAPQQDMDHPEQPDVSVSIVSYNTCDFLRACLNSLQARANEGEATLEIIVADNGSTDGSREMVQNEFPGVRLVDTGGNIGYGRGNNAGLEHARGRYFLIFNSDAETPPGALAALLKFLDATPRAGVAGAQLISPDGSLQTSWDEVPTLFDILCEQLYIPRKRRQDKSKDGEAFEVPWICGASLMVRSEVFREVDGFDPAYFMYFEDTDLCVRIRKAGHPVFFVPAARVKHHLGASSGRDWQLRARMIVAYNQSRFTFFSNNRGRIDGALVKLYTVTGAALRLMAWSIIALLRPARRDQVRLFAKTLADTVRMKPHVHGIS